MAANLQVPKDLNDQIAMRQFLTALANQQGVGSGDTITNVYPTTGVPMDTTKYDNSILFSELELGFKSSKEKSYTEYIFTGKLLKKIEIYEDNFKTLMLYSKIFGYNINNTIDTITITDEVEVFTLTKAFTYVDGRITTKEIL